MDELAFPQPSHGATGMTLRDYFAASVLPAAYFRLAQRLGSEFTTAAIGDNDGLYPSIVENMVAEDAYSMADAMLKARHGD